MKQVASERIKLDSRLQNHVQRSFEKRPFVVLVDHFPPFALISKANDKPEGPLIELIDLFARQISAEPQYQTIHNWDAVGPKIRSREATTVAAPIYIGIGPRVHVPVCSFCTIDLMRYLMKRTLLTNSVRGALADIREVVGNLDLAMLKTWRDDIEQELAFVGLTKGLQESVDTFLRAIGNKKGFAAPIDFIETRLLYDNFAVPVEPITSWEPSSIREKVEQGYVAVVNAVTEAEFLTECTGDDYVTGHLLGRSLSVQAGLPFPPEEPQLAKLFEQFVRAGHPTVERLLDLSCGQAARKLVANAREVCLPKRTAAPVSITASATPMPTVPDKITAVPVEKGVTGFSQTLNSPNRSVSRYDFFIAYATPDRQQAQNLCWFLQDHSREVFLDVEALSLGALWQPVLREALEASRAVVVLVSTHTDAAFYQQEEIVRAIQLIRDNPRAHTVIPIILEKLPQGTVSMPYGMSSLHAQDATRPGGLKRVAAELVAWLDAHQLDVK